MKARILVCLVIFVLAAIKNADAQTTYNWTGNGANSIWSTVANWESTTKAGVTTNPATTYPGQSATTDIVQIGVLTTLPTFINNPTISAAVPKSITSLTIGGAQAVTLTISNTLTVSGTTSVSGSTITATAVFTTNTLTATSSTITLGSAITMTGTLSATGSAITLKTASSIAAVTFVSGTNSLTLGGTLTMAGALTFTNGTNTINTTTTTIETVSPGSVVVTAGTVYWGSTLIFALPTGQNVNIASTGTVYNSATLNIGTPNTSSTLTNAGTLNFLALSSITLGKKSTFTTSGILNSKSATFTIDGNGNGTNITNTGTFTDHGSTFALTGSNTFIQNSGSPGLMYLHGSTVTMNKNGGIVNSGTLTADSASTITLSGGGSYITNSGIFNAGTGGTASSPCAITLSGAGGYITNSSIFNLGSTSIITLSAGSAATVTNSGTFTLESDQYGSASTAEASGTSFAGTYNVQRYLSGGNTEYRSYHLLSSPVNIGGSYSGDISLSYLNTNQNITNANGIAGTIPNYGALTAGPGGTGGGFTIYNYAPTLYLYRESNYTSNEGFTAGKYVGISTFSGNNITYTSTQAPTSGTVPVPVGNGYLMYFIGNNNSTVTSESRIPEATTLTATGLLNQQSVPVTIGTWSTGTTFLGYTAAFAGTPNGVGNGFGSAGFNLVGNPYASVIDLKKVVSDNPSSFTLFYELSDIDPSQGYVTYNGKDSTESSTTLSSRWIASGQGFIVQATAPNQTITFKEDQKVYSASGIINSFTSPAILLTTPQRPTPGLNNLNAVSQPANTRSLIKPPGISGLHLMLQQSSSAFRECGIYFNSQFSDNYDSHDAYDLDGGSVYMSSFTADGVRTSINALGDYTKGKRVKLYVQATADGNYNLKLEDIANIDTSLFNIYIIDHKTLDSVDIVHNKTYAFTITNTDTTSFGANRLTLAVDRKPLPTYQLISFTGQKVKDGVRLNWKTSNEGDYTGFGIQKLDDSKQYTALYNVQSNGDGTYTYIDTHPVKGENTYRLEQINIDSVVSYSSPLAVVYHGPTDNNNPLSVYPNPAREQITVNFSSTTSALTDSYLSCIYNAQGKLVLKQTASSNTWTQDVSALKPGAYVIQVKTASGNSVGNFKFVRVP